MIPLSTTLIRVYRDADRMPGAAVEDGYAVKTAPVLVADGVRAHLSTPSGANTTTDGNRTVYHWRLDADPCDILSDDVIRDIDGNAYRVEWVKLRKGLGLDHVEGSLVQVEGVA